MSRVGRIKEQSDNVENFDVAPVSASPSLGNRSTGSIVVSPGIMMTTWQKRDWRQFYDLARRPWRRHRPPRPVYPSGLNRVAPAQGYSLSELDDAGVDLDLAEQLGLPVDAGRIGVYGPNVTVLREFIRSNRHPL
jgi:ribosomal protein L13E